MRTNAEYDDSQVREGEFIRGLAVPEHAAIAVSDASGHWFNAQCTCGWRSEDWWCMDKQYAQRGADAHNKEMGA